MRRVVAQSGTAWSGRRSAPSRTGGGASMNFQERLADICRACGTRSSTLLVGLHDGAHFIEKPNPVTVLTGFKSIGPAAALLYPDGTWNSIVTPRWDAERASCALSRRVRDWCRDLRRRHPDGDGSARRPWTRSASPGLPLPAVGDGAPDQRGAAAGARGRQARVRRRPHQDHRGDRLRPRGGAHRRARLHAAAGRSRGPA